MEDRVAPTTPPVNWIRLIARVLAACWAGLWGASVVIGTILLTSVIALIVEPNRLAALQPLGTAVRLRHAAASTKYARSPMMTMASHMPAMSPARSAQSLRCASPPLENQSLRIASAHM